jgi:apolipoprotein N-acyltransferase
MYHKRRLVPFGEYVPLEGLLRGLIAFFDLPMSGFSRGPESQELLAAGEIAIGTFICYEIAYPDLVRTALPAAGLLLTVSNDTWFGASVGPLQHLEIARMRALENGRDLMRATNNGVSALVDARGQVTARGGQFTREVVRGTVQPRSGMTPFAALGSWPVILLCATLIALTVRARRPL